MSNIKLKASKTYCCAVELDYIEDHIKHAEASGKQQDILERGGKALTNRNATLVIKRLRAEGYKYHPCEHADAIGRCKGVVD